jgi:Rieske Fe-S protein
MSWTRRVFLKETILNWLGLVVGPSAYALMCRGLYRANASTPGEIVIGKLDDFAPKSSKIVYLGSEKVIVGRSSDGSFHAVSATCTHLGCSIRFEERDAHDEFACNCHNSRFDLSGTNLSGVAPTPLRQFKIAVVREDLVLSR